MAHSLNILAYTNCDTLLQWDKQQKHVLKEALPLPLTKEMKKKKNHILLILLFLVGSIALIMKSVPILFFGIWVSVFIKRGLLNAESGRNFFMGTTKRMIHLKEKLQFLEEEILLNSPMQERVQHFPYTKIGNLLLCYKGVKTIDELEASFIQWEMEGKTYQFHIGIDTNYQSLLLEDLLHFLDKKGISVNEMNREGEKLHFLKKELLHYDAPKEEKIMPAIDVKYLKMIEQIGKNENE